MRKAVRAQHAMPVQQISVTPVEWGKDACHGTAEKCQEPTYMSSGGNIVPPERCASQTSTLSNSYDICRICHCEGEGDAPLIAPCYCSGSLRYVHQACLQQWIKSSDIRACELCKFEFIMYSKIKPIMQWEQLELSALERRRVLCSVLCQLMGLTCVLWSLYVLIDRTLEEISRGLLEWPLWTKLIVVTIGFTGSVTFWYFQAKYYFALCRRWRAFNRVIYVQNAPEKIALDSQPRAPSHPEGAASLLGSGGCCGVETEPAVMDSREIAHEQNTNVDLHQGPTTSASHSSKSDGSVCKQDAAQDTRSWLQNPSLYDSKEDLAFSSKSGSLFNDDDVSISSYYAFAHMRQVCGLDTVGSKDCPNSERSSIVSEMDLLPPPAAFIDSATNTELVFENEKPEPESHVARNRSCSGGSGCSIGAGVSPCRSYSASMDRIPCEKESSLFLQAENEAVSEQASADCASDSVPDNKVSSHFMLGSSLTYGRPTRVGYPYMLSTFHPMIPPSFGIKRGKENSSSSSNSGSEECVASLMKKQQTATGEHTSEPVRPWTVGGSYFLHGTLSPPMEDVRADRSASVSESASRPSCHSGSQSPLLSSHTTPSVKPYPKTK